MCPKGVNYLKEHCLEQNLFYYFIISDLGTIDLQIVAIHEYGMWIT